jgi:hypothetical protein
MSDDYLIRHCAPTLAGIKTASLFTCSYDSQSALLNSVRQMNRRLKSKGLRILPLRFSGRKALIYIYRPKKLTADLSNPAAATLLSGYGYDVGSCEKCISKLCQKLRTDSEFPHEIGLFLGYPPEDVCGFINYGPDLCKYSGCWKVYGDEISAQKLFAQYKKCSRIYLEQWQKGRQIEHLTVSG